MKTETKKVIKCFDCLSVLVILIVIAWPSAAEAEWTIAAEPMGANQGLYFASIQWGDYDNDGDLDLAVSGWRGQGGGPRLIVFRNDGGIFTNAAEPMGVNYGEVVAGVVQWGDYDNDGDLDLAVSGTVSNEMCRLIVFRNDGGIFTNATEPLGVNQGLGNGESVQWGDYDNDGDLDLAVSGQHIPFFHYHRLIIFRNDGNGTFTNAAEPLGVNQGVIRGSIQWGDYDNDGDLDLAVSGSYYHINSNVYRDRLIIFRNDGSGIFTNAAEPMGANQGLANGSIQWGDYDNDRDLDLAVSGLYHPNSGTFQRRLIIFRNDGGIFTNTTEPMGANQGVWMSSIQWGDYDNDGDLDLAVSGRRDWEEQDKLTIFRNDGGNFVNVAEPMGVNRGLHGGSIQWGDYDNDRDLDLAVSGMSGHDSRDSKLLILRNDETIFPNRRPDAPVLLSPRSGQPNQGGHSGVSTIGFKWSPVTTDETPSRAMTYNLRVGRYGPLFVDVVSADPDPTHEIGNTILGNVQNGITAFLQNLRPGTYWWSVQAVDGGMMRSGWAKPSVFQVIADPFICNCSGDMNGDGSINSPDIRAFYDCVINSPQTSNCACADMNGDGNVDQDDYAQFLERLHSPNPSCEAKSPGKRDLLSRGNGIHTKNGK